MANKDPGWRPNTTADGFIVGVILEESAGITQALNTVTIAMSLLAKGKSPAKFVDEAALEAKLRSRIDTYLQRLSVRFQEEISKRQFAWPRTIWRPHDPLPGQRKKPILPPLDIIDTGAFKRSQEGPEAESRRLKWFRVESRYVFIWSVPYAHSIFWGMKDRDYPGRDWVSPVFKRTRIGRL